jgi:hypothetical protein
MRRPWVLFLVVGGLLATPSTVQAVTLDDLAPEKICVAGAVDKKLFMQAVLGIKKCDAAAACTSPENVAKAADMYEVRQFLRDIERNFPGRFALKSAPFKDGYIDYGELIKNIDQHVVCLDSQPSIRTRIDKFSKEVGQSLLVRKDVDNLEIADLSTAKPASFGYSKDWPAANAVTSYEVAVGHIFKGALDAVQKDSMPYTITPYARFVGQFNTNPKKTDIDIAAAGLRGDIYSIPFFGIVENHLSLRGEYITDSIARSAIAAGEVTWEPIPAFDPTRPHAFGHPQYYFGPDGPYIKLDVTGRFRFGQVFDPGLKPTILTQESYVRLGAKAGIMLGFGGSDIFSGFSVYGTYLYFDTVAGAGGSFEKIEAGVTYQVTSNFGFTVKYVEGTDEDKLEPVHKLEAGFTVKF